MQYKFIIGIWQQFAQNQIVIKTRPLWFNGSPGILIFENDNLATAITIDANTDGIQRIYAIRNPDKLVPFSNQIPLNETTLQY